MGGMEIAHEGMIWSLAWHPLGHILCSGSNDHTRYTSSVILHPLETKSMVNVNDAYLTFIF